jgi:hypothetical protein
MFNIEQHLGIKLAVLFSGLIGGVASLTYHQKMSTYKALLLILSGAATAAYLQPVFHHYLELPENLSVGTGFVLGLVSMKLLNFIMETITPLLKRITDGSTDNNKSNNSPS